jgi:hypothetical protein
MLLFFFQNSITATLFACGIFGPLLQPTKNVHICNNFATLVTKSSFYFNFEMTWYLYHCSLLLRWSVLATNRQNRKREICFYTDMWSQSCAESSELQMFPNLQSPVLTETNTDFQNRNVNNLTLYVCNFSRMYVGI